MIRPLVFAGAAAAVFGAAAMAQPGASPGSAPAGGGAIAPTTTGSASSGGAETAPSPSRPPGPDPSAIGPSIDTTLQAGAVPGGDDTTVRGASAGVVRTPNPYGGPPTYGQPPAPANGAPGASLGVGGGGASDNGSVGGSSPPVQ
jgi:hypothetical protein